MCDFSKMRPVDRQLYVAARVAAALAAVVDGNGTPVYTALGASDHAWAVARELNRRYVAASGGEG